MRPVSKFLIYGLRDPRTMEIRYVGKSSSGLRRPKQHLENRKEKSYKNNWIRSLQKIGIIPEIVVLQQCERENDLDGAEKFWIAIGFAALCKRFTNGTFGGDGGRLTEDTKSKISATSRNQRSAPEYREKISADNRKRWADPTYKVNMSTSQRERWTDPTYRAKMSAESRKRWADPTYRAKVSASQHERWADPTHKAKVSVSQREAWIARKAKSAPKKYLFTS